MLEDSVYVTGDISRDERWPAFGARAYTELGITSVLAHRLILADDIQTVAALNLYAASPDAMGDHAVAMSLVLATHASLLVSTGAVQDRAQHLERALRSNREIGVAMGVLMQQHRLTREQAFDVLRVASQDSNRKLADLATEVADTGVLSFRRWPARRTALD